MLIINSYRPPAGRAEVACEKLISTMSKIDNLRKYEIVIVGDLNMNCSDPNSECYKHVEKICNELNLKSCIDLPTRLTQDSNSIIDLILTNIKNINSFGVINYNISDHLPVFLIKKRVSSTNKKIWVKGRSYKNYDREKFMFKLAQLDWSILYLLNDPNDAWHMIFSAIMYEVDAMCPMREFKVHASKPEWYTAELIEQARERDRLARYAKRQKTKEAWENFAKARNQYNSDIKKAKNDYTIDLLERNAQNQTKFWLAIKDLLPVKSRVSPREVVDPETNELRDGVDAANVINDFFASIGSKLSSELPDIQSPYSPQKTNSKIDCFPQISLSKVCSLINSISTYKSSGMKQISSRLLKDALLAIPEQIALLFNLSLNTGIVPEAWKEGLITPIVKKGDATNVNNLRPITQTPIVGKLLERYVTDHITDYLEENKLLYEGQGGFRKKHSTVRSAYSLVSDVCTAKNNREYTLAVFLDLSKAFDSINHVYLIEKLENIGIDGNVRTWIINYLRNRKQSVRLEGVFSEKQNVECGVPQGSVIGPMLFLIYVNDIISLNLKSKVLLFADDTVIYYRGKDLENVSRQVQEDLDILSKWCCFNKLCVNVDKTKTMFFGNNFNFVNTDNCNLKLCDREIENVQTYEYLGIVIDVNVSFKDHALKIIRTINNKLYLLSLLRKQLTTKCAILLYKSMILPYFEYGDVFISACTEAILSRLQLLQNRGLRIAFKRDPLSSVNQLHIDAHLLPLKFRRKISTIKLMFDMKDNDELRDNSRLFTRLHDFITLVVPFPRTERFKRSICYVGPKHWNELPGYLKSINDRVEFKIALNNYFWNVFLDSVS